MSPTAWADIDTAALRHNAAQVRRLAPAARIMAMLKADAYGHGLLAVARALESRVDGLAVARVEEAQALRAAGLAGPLLVTSSWFDDEALAWCAAHGVWIVVHEPAMLARLETLVLPGRLGVWLKLNTGMNRLGLPGAALADAVTRLRALPQVELQLLMTHFASADEPPAATTQAQIRRFHEYSAGLGLPASLANSAGIIGFPEAHADWVRPGIMLFGDNPLSATRTLELKPVMHFRARVLAVNAVRTGDRVGYGGEWTAPRPGRIALLGAGYGDGYPRHVQPGTPVALGSRLRPIVGRVSMDLIAVELAAGQQVRAGDVATLWGDSPRVGEVARQAGTISYELLSQVTGRVPRITV